MNFLKLVFATFSNLARIAKASEEIAAHAALMRSQYIREIDMREESIKAAIAKDKIIARKVADELAKS